ncbi:ABC1 kinase family protein [Propionibacterium freudenreichii]|uniref:ABC1 kinase family protein n=1 Tax=Propionibacterium freudenreichii TaxID=1744 RepID=UPI0005A5C6AD|nr:AarF/ABC1/UbiB kinase family protein [Propionibacterium freudenreichii]MDK9332322.1 AarF/ABC1/UbiB kinase family protein [Propionibacterium freudenreichii]CEI50160.1 ABC1 family protein [Propionibacterium freudenreichii]
MPAPLLELLVLALLAVAMAQVPKRIIAGVSFGRRFVASLLVFLLTLPAGTWVVEQTRVVGPDDTLQVNWFVFLLVMVLCFVWVFAAALTALVALELVLPSGSLPSPIQSVRDIRMALRRHRRYLQLGWIAMSSGLWKALRKGPDSPGFGEALVKMLNRSGVTFIKLGQVLSTRPDVLPGAVMTALTSLWDTAAPAPEKNIRTMLRSQWGRDPEEVLGSFDDTPFAAASIAQVHRATLKDGTAVVIKVQRPGAAEQVVVDSDILLRFTRLAEQRFAWARAMGVDALGRGMTAALKEELDYRREARNTKAIAATLADNPAITTPVVNQELTREKVLVMSPVNGSSLASKVDTLDDDTRRELARTLMATALQGILVHGIFHADLHPGNILLLDDGRIGLLDFGSVGVIDAETRQLVAALLVAFVADDNSAATTAVTAAFDVDDTVDRMALQRDLGRALTLLAHTGDESTATFNEFFTVMRDYRITIPGDVAGAFRTLTSLEGTLTALTPGYGLLAGAEDAMPSIVAKLAAPKQLAMITASTAMTSALLARRLPARTEQITDMLARGQYTLNTRMLSDDSDREWLRSRLDDAMSSLFAAVAVALAVVFIVIPGGPAITSALTGYDLAGAAIGCVGLVLILRLMVRLFTRHSGRP